MAGIYIHIPFCKQACTYCNFHFSTSLRQKPEMVAAIIKEIQLCDYFDNDEKNIETIYFGGGTPSLLNDSELSAILSCLREKFNIDSHAEITLEANPDNMSIESLSNWLQLGINRLSVGIQSFDEEELVWMNRAHNATESIQCIAEMKRAGFENYSVDLIYGSPLQSAASLAKNLNYIFQHKVPHISCYALTVEPKTLLNRLILEHKSLPINPDVQSERFELLLQMMNKEGYEQYEISNFSLPGFRSKHNSSYWQGKAYYGFGPSAHSFDGNETRQWNLAHNAHYIQAIENNIIPTEIEVLTSSQRLNEYVMTSLRTIEGINIDKLQTNFGTEELQRILRDSKKFQQRKLVVLEEGFLKLTVEGKFLADGIASDLFTLD